MLDKGIGREIEYDYNTDDDEVNKISILNLDLSIGSLIRKNDNDSKLLYDCVNNKSESQNCYYQLHVNQLDLSEEMYRQLNYVHNDSCYDNIRKSIVINEFIMSVDDNELKYEVDTCSLGSEVKQQFIKSVPKIKWIISWILKILLVIGLITCQNNSEYDDNLKVGSVLMSNQTLLKLTCLKIQLMNKLTSEVEVDNLERVSDLFRMSMWSRYRL